LEVKTIRHASDLPDWFHLDNYRAAKDMDAFNWYIQLKYRHRSYVSGQGDDFFSDDPSPPYTGLINPESEFEVSPEVESGVAFLSLSKQEQWPREIWEATRFLKRSRLQNCSIEESEKIFAENEEFEKYLSENEESMGGLQYNPHANAIDKALIQVDLAYSDARLKSDFSEWLKMTRRLTTNLPGRDPKIKTKKYSDAVFRNWTMGMFLPYLDLDYWQQYSSTKIEEKVLGEALFGSHFSGELGSRLRNTRNIVSREFNIETIYEILSVAKTE
jgi:hypothetical protein